MVYGRQKSLLMVPISSVQNSALACSIRYQSGKIQGSHLWKAATSLFSGSYGVDSLPSTTTLPSTWFFKIKSLGGEVFPGGTVVKNPPAGLPWWRSG